MPPTLIHALKSFAEEHNGAKAIIEYLGRRGARIVLVGQDGEWGDQVAPATDIARQACAAAGVPVENGWERSLLEEMAPMPQLHRDMGRRVLAR